MNSRLALAGYLRKKLPRRYKIIEAPRDLDAPETKRPVVMLIKTNRKPAPEAPAGIYIDTFAVWVIEPKKIAPEDDLDDALDSVVEALDAYPFITWDDAERSTLAEQPAYRINTQVVTKKE